MKNIILILLLFFANSLFAQHNINNVNFFKKTNTKKDFNTFPERNGLQYATINTIGLTYFVSSSLENNSAFNITTIHGITRETEMGKLFLGGGLNLDFYDTLIVTIFYESRLFFTPNLNGFANLGYSFGDERFKGFAFASGIGIPFKVSPKLSIIIESGYGGKGKNNFLFLRGGIFFN